jgi:hypothetical protein
MPYIKQIRRKDFENILKTIDNQSNDMTSGDLNYLISSILNRIVTKRGQSYELYNSLIGVLECVKLELYRQKISKYENEKIMENGDIY